MRILILGINYYPELTGIGKYTGELAIFFAQRGHQVRMVTAPPYYPAWRVMEGYRPWTYQRETIQGVEVIRCPIWVPSHPHGFTRLLHLVSFALSSLLPMLIQSSWKPHLILTIAPAIASAPNAWVAARLARCKAWLHIQDFELDAAFRLGMLPGLRFTGRLLQKLESFLLNRFDKVSTISQRMLAHLQNKRVNSEKTSLLVNWVDCQEIFPMDRTTPLRAEWQFSADTIVVLYSGNLGQKQGLDTLVESARLLQDEPMIQFVICGDGAARETLRNKAADIRNLRFHPLLPVGRLNELLSTADIHVLPQRKDAADLVMPSKLSGMLASGRPVIATAFPGTELSEVISQVGILVPPENPHQLAEAIQKLARQPELRIELGQRGRVYAVEHWSKEHVLNKFLKEVESISI